MHNITAQKQIILKKFRGSPRRLWHAVSLGFILFLTAYIGIMSLLYPMQGDDFFFAWNLRENGMGQWLQDAYFNWTLRLGEIFNMLLLHGGKLAFDLFNPFLQFALAWALFSFASGRRFNGKRCIDCAELAIFLAMNSVLLARPRDTVYWMTGANVYSFGMAVWFSFWGWLWRESERTDLPAPASSILYPLWGCAAALTLENNSMCGIAAGGFLLLRQWKLHRTWSPAAKWAMGGYIAGVILFFTQPGRWQRLQHAVSGSGRPEGFISSVIEVGLFHGVAAFFAILLLLACGFLLWHQDRQRFRRELPANAALLLLSWISSGCFILSGVTPAMRAYLFPSLLTGIVAVRLWAALYKTGPRGKHFCRILWGITIAAALFQMIRAVPDFLRISRENQTRSQLIRQATPGTAVTVPVHTTLRRDFFQYIWVEDITPQPDNPFNIYYARYYKLSAISTTGNTQVPLFWKKR